MKIFIQSLICWLFIWPSHVYAHGGFSITGEITGVKNGYVSIIGFGDGMENNLDDIYFEKVKILDGKFIFKGKLNHPGVVRLKISTRDIVVFLENEEYTLSGVLNTLTTASLKGGRANEDLVKFNQSGLSYMEFIKQNPNSLLSGFYAVKLSSESYGMAKNCLSCLGSRVRSSWYGRQLESVIAQYDSSSALTTFPDLGLKAQDGKPFSLSHFKGSVVVLDFWASWCGPCRAYIPTMKALYNQYRDKAVAFVGISGDDNVDDWKFALGQEKMPWEQALADGGFSKTGAIQRRLSIYHIPYVIILDKKGNIAARLDYQHKDQIQSVVDRLL